MSKDWNHLLEPCKPEELESLYEYVMGSGMTCKCGRRMLYCIEGYWCPLRWWGNFWKHTPVTRYEVDSAKRVDTIC